MTLKVKIQYLVQGHTISESRETLRVLPAPEPSLLAPRLMHLFPMLQDPGPAFSTCNGSLPTFSALLMPENISYTPGKNPVGTDRLLHKEGAVQGHITLMEPLIRL